MKIFLNNIIILFIFWKASTYAYSKIEVLSHFSDQMVYFGVFLHRDHVFFKKISLFSKTIIF
jgi:hypothetical protein